MAAKAKTYDNESISSLKGADRVRKRPGVIFGSDGIEGCQHSAFEILSNAIDEARSGYGKKIILTQYADGAIEVQDFGRGCPVDYNPKEEHQLPVEAFFLGVVVHRAAPAEVLDLDGAVGVLGEDDQIGRAHV